jgi:hypothetical protein
VVGVAPGVTDPLSTAEVAVTLLAAPVVTVAAGGALPAVVKVSSAPVARPLALDAITRK